jgi:uncharacterized protein YrzB (UPF0473 family)
MITVEYDEKGEVIIVFDKNGGESLIKKINGLIEERDTHYHLMTEEWSGNELSSKAFNSNNKLINMVRLQFTK